MSGFFNPYFQSFYYEVLKQKEKALRLGEVDNVKALEDSSEEGDEETSPKTAIEESNIANLVVSIQKRLHHVLLTQSRELQRQTGAMVKASHIHRLHYLFVALADEIFINLPWHGAEFWSHHLLEAHIFGTQMAGENIFSDIEDLMEEIDPMAVDMAEVYLFAVGLGFKGRLRYFEEDIQKYQKRLKSFIDSQLSTGLSDNETYLMPNCYQHTFTEPPARGLPDVKTWTLWIGGVLLCYWLVSYGVWHSLSKDIRKLTNQIVAQGPLCVDN